MSGAATTGNGASNGPGWTFTMVSHDMIDSMAALTLSPQAYGLLLDWLRRWGTITHNGTRPRPIPFCWTACRRIVGRKGFASNRAELERHMFIECTNRKLGLFVPSENWRKYSPDKQERGALAYIRRRQRAQRTATIQRRGDTTNDGY